MLRYKTRRGSPTFTHFATTPLGDQTERRHSEPIGRHQMDSSGHCCATQRTGDPSPRRTSLDSTNVLGLAAPRCRWPHSGRTTPRKTGRRHRATRTSSQARRHVPRCGSRRKRTRPGSKAPSSPFFLRVRMRGTPTSTCSARFSPTDSRSQHRARTTPLTLAACDPGRVGCWRCCCSPTSAQMTRRKPRSSNRISWNSHTMLSAKSPRIRSGA